MKPAWNFQTKLSCFSIEREFNSNVTERIDLQGLCRSGEHDKQVGSCLQKITSPWIKLLLSAPLHFWWATFQPFASQCSFNWHFLGLICFPFHMYVLIIFICRKEFGIWNLWLSPFSSTVKLSKLLIYCTSFLKKFFNMHFRRCSNILTIGPSTYPVSGQNRQEGICSPVVNQLSIYSFPGRGRTLWRICFHTLVVNMRKLFC